MNKPSYRPLHSALFLAIAAASGALVPQVAAAQSSQVEKVALEEVVVTATRREEGVQDVPISVTAVSGDELVRSNFREATDIQYLAPNVTFSSTRPVSNGGGFQIRGVGTQTYDSGVEQSVGLVVDGVVIGMSRDPGITGFSDVERVEVLRGPQGTLFGKNSSAGVIQIVTKAPRLNENSGDIDLSFGERQERIGRGNFNLALGDSAALRLSGYYQAQDGAIPYVAEDGPDGHIGDRENKGVRAKLLWEASDSLSALLIAEHQRGFARDAHTIESLGDPEALMAAGDMQGYLLALLYQDTFADFETQPGEGVFQSYQDGDWTAETEVNAASVQLDYQLGDFTLTSISAYRELVSTQLADIDAAPIDIFNHSDGGVDSSQITQELRLTSPSGERLEYVLGTFFYKTDQTGWALQYGDYYDFVKEFFLGIPGDMPVVLGGGRREQGGGTRSLAAFGNATYELSDSFELIAGLRYTEDEVTGSLTVMPTDFPSAPLGLLPDYDGEVSAENVSGRVGIQYRPSDNLMLYATYSTGYKGPAIDGTSGTVREVDPETVKSYELGAKSTLLDGRMTLNATLYSSDFSDFQAQTLDASGATPVFRLANAGLMRARGLELESSLRLGDGFTLSAGAAYNDATFEEYIGNCYPGQPVLESPGPGCYMDAAAGTLVADYAGARLPNAPEWSYSLRGLYEHTLDNGLLLDGSVIWSWRDESYAVTADPKSVMDAFGILNANLGIGSEQGSWRLGLYARNLLDERFYATYAATALLNPGGYNRIVSPDAFRTVGVNFKLYF